MVPFKLQFFCFILLLYVTINFYRGRNSRKKALHTLIFEILLWLEIAYLFLDMGTVYTVNHIDTVNSSFNLTLHHVFLLSIDTSMFLIFLYLCALCELKPRRKAAMLGVTLPYIVSVIVATASIDKLEYILGKETNYSMGVPVYVCYATGFSYFLIGIVIFFKRRRYIAQKKAIVLLMTAFFAIGTLIIQMIFPETLISSIPITLLLLVIYEWIENQTVTDLEHIYEEIIHSFSDIIEGRDDNTGQHIKRTTIYVKIISESLRQKNLYTNILTKDYIDCLLLATPMHDIGKITVSDLILQKPGKLTEEEFEQMKLHTVKGGELIEKSLTVPNDMYKQMAYQIALHHHEKWNGKGYPKGLKGEEIPLPARIVAVADVFDAISQDRCYRRAMSLDESFAIIQKGIGVDFDPVISQCFLESREKVETAYRKIKDLAVEL